MSIGAEFIWKQCAGMETPAYYLPGDQFSSYAKGLVKAWVMTLKRLYELHELGGSILRRIHFRRGLRAECEQSSEYGLVYYLSPAEIVKNQKYGSRSFKARFSSAWAGRFEIMSLAAHEFTHAAFGLAEHSEDFAAKLTDVMTVMLSNIKDFSPYFGETWHDGQASVAITGTRISTRGDARHEHAQRTSDREFPD